MIARGSKRTPADVDLLRASPLFEARRYRARHPVSVTARLWPERHFLRHGNAHACDPHPLFDTAFYLETYEDVAASGMNALVHYLRFGWRQGRDPHPLFETLFVRRQLRQLGIACGADDPLTLYVARLGQGVDPSPYFETGRYLSWLGARAARELRETTPLEHYLDHAGETDPSFSPSPRVDMERLARSLPDTDRGRLLYIFARYRRTGGRQGRWHPGPEVQSQLQRLVRIEPGLSSTLASLERLPRFQPPGGASHAACLVREAVATLGGKSVRRLILVSSLESPEAIEARAGLMETSISPDGGASLDLIVATDATVAIPIASGLADNLTTLDLLEIAPDSPEEERIKALAHIMLAASPEQIVDAGSAIGRETLRRFRARLSKMAVVQTGNASAEGQRP